MSRPETLSHEQAAELLPWLVNDSLATEEKASLLAHAQDCVVCRREIGELESLQDRLSVDDALDAVPAPDMRRINRRIDDYEARRLRLPGILSSLREFFSNPWRTAVVAQSAVIAALVATLLMPAEDPTPYTALTQADQLPAGSYLRIVVSVEMSDERWSDLLDRFDLTLADGPSERGVATLSLSTPLSDDEKAALVTELSADPDVRFVQPLEIARR